MCKKVWNLRLAKIICSYVECTSAVIQALAAFKKLYPGYRKEEVDHCIRKGASYIEKIQAADGSWLVLVSSYSLFLVYCSFSPLWLVKPLEFT